MITLDPATEERIQKQLSRGAFAEPGELLAHALDLVEEEEDWLLENQVAINAGLDEALAQAAQGEGYSLEEAKRLLLERRASRAA